MNTYARLMYVSQQAYDDLGPELISDRMAQQVPDGAEVIGVRWQPPQEAWRVGGDREPWLWRVLIEWRAP